MKKIYKLMAFLVFAIAMTACSKNKEEEDDDLTQRIPDPKFKEYLIDSFDKDTDFKLSKAEIECVTDIKPPDNSQIRSLAGIEIFTNLNRLLLMGSKVQTIDLSQNLKIRALGLKTNTNLKILYLPKAVEKLCTINNEDNAEIIFK